MTWLLKPLSQGALGGKALHNGEIWLVHNQAHVNTIETCPVESWLVVLNMFNLPRFGMAGWCTNFWGAGTANQKTVMD